MSQNDKELEILKFWQDNKIFDASLQKPSPMGNFVFYEGPPTANGKPGIHHVLARVFKDLIPRYKTMQGYHVERKSGWDTHGLPVELQVQKELGLQGKPEIEAYGIEKFNEKCRESVWQFKAEFEELTKRMGFWLDMEHPYVTYEQNYIESVWNIVKKIWDQGLIYQGYKVVPHCPSCGTTLSSHEVAQGYKTVKDRSVYIKFKVAQDSKVAKKGDYILSWTTTPWTLPGNVALAVGERIDYVRLKIGNDYYILAENLVKQIFPETTEATKTFAGKDLVGTTYEPLFPGVITADEAEAFEVVPADFVSTTDGTGVVHTAVMYGVDDFDLGLQFGLPQQHTVDLAGKFLPSVTGFSGMFVKGKTTEDKLLAYLQEHGILLKEDLYEHEYPFCWRCGTPLLYYAKTSWFVAMTKVQSQLVKNAETINWYPSHIKKGRFGEWLDGIKDWAISRERYWGTPLPIWQCQQCDKQRCIGSFSELPEALADVHRPYIDDVVLDCDCGGTMRRVPEVLDVWFDSGAMPWAQHHYPFEHEHQVDSGELYPADFICEAIDQTRGWFYTLLALSTVLKQGASYKNVICLGHINDAKGQKMSKSKGNIVDPWMIAEKYGMDPVRYFFFSSSQPGETKNFDERQLLEVVKKVFMTLGNCLAFYKMFAPAGHVTPSAESPDMMDRWIIAKTQELIATTTEQLEAYQITESSRNLGEFINELSTWYIRRSRDRFKSADSLPAVQTLAYVLTTLSKLLAPFTPFTADGLWRDLGHVEPKSVHLAAWPTVQLEHYDKELLGDMDKLRSLVESAHAVRSQAKLKVRQPLARAAIKLDLPETLRQILAEEINVLEITVDQTLPSGGSWMPADSGEIALDVAMNPELQAEGNIRELVRCTNALRKQAKLSPKDSVVIHYQTESAELKELIQKRSEDLQIATISRSWEEASLFTEQTAADINGTPITISLRM